MLFYRDRYRDRLLARISAPAVEPLSLTESKLYLRIDQTLEDTLVSNLITAARQIAESYLNRSLITQSWMIAFDYRAPREAYLPYGPVQSVSSVTSYDALGNATVISTTSYSLNASQTALRFCQPVTAHQVQIAYTAGYGNDYTHVPEPIRQGMLAHVASLYENRGDAEMPMPTQTIALYAPFREVRL